MVINVFFDELFEDADVIDIPESVWEEIENIKATFFKWLFNKKINHKYWVTIDGEKKYCSYRAEAFVYWLNNFYLLNNNKKAICLNAEKIDYSRPKINF